MALTGGIDGPARQKALENLVVLYRRSGEHERALHICSELMNSTDFSLVGYEGSAIYAERVARDYESALSTLEKALARAESPRVRKLLQARWDRLRQKIIRF
jgi:lipopolysaccharide biosynthesis regulator YciM